MSRHNLLHRFASAQLLFKYSLALLLLLSLTSHAHEGAGSVSPPVAIPDIQVTLNNQQKQLLSTLFKGKITALQFIFTGCSSVCPIQASMFKDIQAALPSSHTIPPIQLVSLSIDSLNDTPQKLSEWLIKFKARPNWIAAVPSLKDQTILKKTFLENNSSANSTPSIDTHTNQVYIIDTTGKIIWRSVEIPSSKEIVSILKTIQIQQASKIN